MLSTRLISFAICGAAALSVTACGSSNNSSPPTSPSSVVAATPTTSAPAAPKGDARVRGLIASVSGNSVQVSQQNGSATVGFTGSTKITEVSGAALTDVAVGSCVSVRSNGDSQSATAASVRINPAGEGNCSQRGGASKVPQTKGTVTSVAGNLVTINTAGGSQTVMVTDKTRYTKVIPATSQAITEGKCIAARGSESGGALQATTITVQPATDGKCFNSGTPHRR